MHRRLPRHTAVVLAATAALFLAGCGGGDDGDKKGDGKISGADETTKSASPSASSSETAGRPKIEVPADLTYDFEWAKTGDKDKDAVLHDGEQFVRATDMAIVEQDPLNKAYLFYSEGDMSASTQEYVQDYVDAKARVTGKYRFYDATATLNKDNTAALVYCEDQSKAYVKHLKSGKVDVEPPTKKSYTFYATRLRKNERGVWVTTYMHSERGSAKCQP